MPDNTAYLFLLLLPLIAGLYASVGHGGASGYLALMALFNFAPSDMKLIALVLNILISLISFSQFYKPTKMKWPLFLALTITSIPMAFIGGGINVETIAYKIILGFILIIPAVRLLIPQPAETDAKPVQYFWAVIFGAIIGFLSGLIGIGGGIILSPLLLWLGWSKIKETASISALFIFVNSISGLLGHPHFSNSLSALQLPYSIWLILGLALAGGLLGSFLGSKKLNAYSLRVILSVVLWIACIKLILVS